MEPTTTTLEPDMAQAHSFFTRAANAIVNASEFATRVESLCAEVAMLTSQVDRLRNDNGYLSEQLDAARAEIVTRQQDITTLRADLNQAHVERDNSDVAVRTLSEQLSHAHEEVHNLLKERDDAISYGLELEAKLTKAQTKLDKFLALAAPEPGEVKPQPEATPQPHPIQAIEDHSSAPLQAAANF